MHLCLLFGGCLYWGVSDYIHCFFIVGNSEGIWAEISSVFPYKWSPDVLVSLIVSDVRIKLYILTILYNTNCFGQ